MEDYKTIMKDLFLRYYAPTGEEWQMKYISTYAVLSMFQGVIPSQPINEHDVFDLLKELGFHQDLETIYEKVLIVEEDKNEGIEAEYDNIEVGKIFKWVIFEK